jgi:hypothetical protein
MGISMGPSLYWLRSRLYRKLPQAVILALAITALVCTALIFSASGQIAKRRPADKGPRALGLLELATNGRAHLVPVTIMIGGKFYDASAYKADPVPMALQSETVYEALKSGVSQGLFTVRGAAHGPEGWFGDGKWRSTADIEAEKTKAKADAEKRAQKAPLPEQQVGAPPKLTRGGGSSKTSPAPEPSPTPPSKSEKTSSTENSAAPVSVDDSHRPVLRRQPVSETAHEQTKPGIDAEPLKGTIQFIPAISDADGPDPRSYAYPMRPEDEPGLLKKMLAMAGDEVTARARQNSVSPGETKPKAHTAKNAAAPEFQGIQMHVFDPSSSNESVLVLTANATLGNGSGDLVYMTVLVARQDIYGDLHKVFVQTTDSKHLDVLPKYELIDAVDADGDGRGELLFRLTSQTGSAFSIYRVIGDKLWPLFEGKPGA